ncbi:MAG: heme-binding domain-containing protein [Chloroflexota bacterium]
MIRSLQLSFLTILAMFVVLQLVPIERSNPAVTREIRWDSQTTKTLAQRACYDCHSNETTWPWYGYIAPVSWLVSNHVSDGRESLNFSEWNQPNGSPVAVLGTIRDGDMPLSEYVMMHPEAKLTADEMRLLIEGLDRTMKADPPIKK